MSVISEIEKCGGKVEIEEKSLVLHKDEPTFKINITFSESGDGKTLLAEDVYVLIKNNNAILEYHFIHGNERLFLTNEEGVLTGEADNPRRHFIVGVNQMCEIIASPKASYDFIRIASSFGQILPENI